MNDRIAVEIIYGGHEAIPELLLGRDADVAQDGTGESPHGSKLSRRPKRRRHQRNPRSRRIQLPPPHQMAHALILPRSARNEPAAKISGGMKVNSSRMTNHLSSRLTMLKGITYSTRFDQPANPISDPGFDRIKPTVEKMGVTLDRRMRRLRLRGNAGHGVVSCPAL